MLLRSASSPLLNYAYPARVPAAEHAGVGHLTVVPVSPAGRKGVLLCRALSDGDLLAQWADGHCRTPTPLSATSSSAASALFEEDEEEEGEDEYEDVVGAPAVPLRRLLTNTGLDAAAHVESSAGGLALLEGVGGGGGRGRVCGSGWQGGGGDGDSSRGAADAHYRRLIEATPGNSLPLGNYARFLKDVEGDVARAQEYCERAIVANPADGDVLALYAGIVWETSRDAERADAYYNRAVQAAPDDCYVLGSYAGFLWDAEEDDLDDGDPPAPTPPPFFGAVQPPAVRAAS